MSTLSRAFFLTVCACLPLACSNTQGSIDSDSIGNPSIASGIQSDWLPSMQGTYDVVYNVFNRMEGPADQFNGSVQYDWDEVSHILTGTHDSMWKTTPFQVSMIMTFDTQQDAIRMGWTASDGQVIQPMQNMQSMGMNEELSITRNQGGQMTRTLIHNQNKNSHTIRRFVTNAAGNEQLVLEMICTRM